MKKIVCFLLLFSFLFLFCSCGETGGEGEGEEREEEMEEISFGMEKVGQGYLPNDKYIYYLKDEVTDVMYIFYSGYNKGGLSVMLDPKNGLPLTYERYQEIYQEKIQNEK